MYISLFLTQRGSPQITGLCRFGQGYTALFLTDSFVWVQSPLSVARHHTSAPSQRALCVYIHTHGFDPSAVWSVLFFSSIGESWAWMGSVAKNEA